MSTVSERLLPANPHAGYLCLRAEIDAAIRRVLDSGRYIQDRETATFEAEFAAYNGAAHAVGTGSGTDALELALRACGIGPGDAVVTVSHTAVATVAAIDLVGATPVLVDVDPKTYTLDPEGLKTALNGPDAARIRAVIPVHLYGHPADMPAILALAGRRNLFVIEDCAQAHGARRNGQRVGTFGHFGAFSFYPTKNLGCLGDGGALVTSDARLAERAQLLKQYGWQERYVSSLAGMNTRLDELQAAVLRAKLPHLDRLNARRRELAALYRFLLADTPLKLPGEAGGTEHVYHQFVVRTRGRDCLRTHLDRHGIGTGVLYPVPVHRQPGYGDRVIVPAGGLPHTERLCEQILSLPLYPEMTDADARRAACTAAAWLEAEES